MPDGIGTELMLVDQAMIGYFQAVRLNKELAKMLSLMEDSLYWGERPSELLVERFRGEGATEHLPPEEYVRMLQRQLAPLIERFNRMFLRNLRALRELRAGGAYVRIDRAGQVNVAEQQVVACPDGGPD